MLAEMNGEAVEGKDPIEKAGFKILVCSGLNSNKLID